MKHARTGLAAVLAILIAAPHAAAQQALHMPAPAPKPAFSFTKDPAPAAPIPKLNLFPMVAMTQDPDPTGLLAAAGQASDEGVSKWLVGGLALLGVGGTILYYGAEQENPETQDEMVNISIGFIGAGLGVMLIGAIANLDKGPSVWVGKTRGGVAGGVRVPIGRR